jgi:outer membrane protein assembly factor BamB
MALALVFLVTELTLAGLQPAQQPPSLDKLTYHYDSQRTGWNDREMRLTPESVSGPAFGELWQTPQLDSFNDQPPRLYATLLYVDDVKISSGQYQGRSFSVLYAVTDTGYTYAVNAFAAGNTPPGTILWRKQLTDKPEFCGNLSTPIIDPRQHRIYVTGCEARTWSVHALDIRNGEEVNGWPVAIAPAAVNTPGINRNGTTQFPSTPPIQRGALNLSPDASRLYVAFGGARYSGWIIAVDTIAARVATAFSATPKTEEYQGGMWASGGPALDRQGHIHIATGASSARELMNQPDFAGIFPGSAHNWGQSVIKLRDDPRQGFTLIGTYTPFNYCQASSNDIDIGSGGTVVIDLDPATTSTPELLVLGGVKQGNVYLLDRAHMPGSLIQRQPCSIDSTTDRSLLSPELQPQFGQLGPVNVFGPYGDKDAMSDQARSHTTPAYFRDAAGKNYIFATGSAKTGDRLETSAPPGLARLEIVASPGKPAYLRIDQFEMTQTLGNPGSPIVTSHGGRDGIVWVLDENARRTTSMYGPNAPRPVLYAFDALTLRLLWKSAPGQLFTSGKYNEPTVVRGVVFVGTDRIQAFGLPAAGTSSVR